LVDEFRALRRFSDRDLLLIHRRCYPPILAGCIERHRGIVVFDCDDALYLPSPSEPQTPRTRRRYRRNFHATTSAADQVICGNTELARHVVGRSTFIIPTPVDCDRFHPDAIGVCDRPTVGWVGHSSNFSSLEEIAEPLRKLAALQPGFKLIVVADKRPRMDRVPMEFRRWSLENEVGCFSGIGVGLMPLEDTRWNRGKCAFKLLQYMALGIPSVASPVGMNNDVITSGENGFFAATNDEWVKRLDELLRDPDLRRRVGRAGRTSAEGGFALPVVSRRLVSFLDRVSGRGGTTVS
jgi:glycosyltransferase involved in cell wall biosynthesis